MRNMLPLASHLTGDLQLVSELNTFDELKSLETCQANLLTFVRARSWGARTIYQRRKIRREIEVRIRLFKKKMRGGMAYETFANLK